MSISTEYKALSSDNSKTQYAIVIGKNNSGHKIRYIKNREAKWFVTKPSKLAFSILNRAPEVCATSVQTFIFYGVSIGSMWTISGLINGFSTEILKSVTPPILSIAGGMLPLMRKLALSSTSDTNWAVNWGDESEIQGICEMLQKSSFCKISQYLRKRAYGNTFDNADFYNKQVDIWESDGLDAFKPLYLYQLIDKEDFDKIIELDRRLKEIEFKIISIENESIEYDIESLSSNEIRETLNMLDRPTGLSYSEKKIEQNKIDYDFNIIRRSIVEKLPFLTI